MADEMGSWSVLVPAGLLISALFACAEPTGLQANAGSSINVLSEGLSPNLNQPVVLHGSGWGRVVFRQPEDGEAKVFYITWLRDLKPATRYLLQQALDSVADGVCTAGTGDPSEWLTIGTGGKPFTITTDDRGSFHAPLYRTLPRRLVGTTFDAHLRIIEEATGAVVQSSGCFQFQVNL
jgi:hypothetical protein